MAEPIAAGKGARAAAARRAGRNPEEISLIAATKTQSSDTIREAIANGIAICGENRVQEMAVHLEDKAYEGAQLHFIGHLQTNKVKQVVGVASLIHSADSPRLLPAISKEAVAKGLVQPVLLAVNIGAEASQSGISPQQLPQLAALAEELPGIC